MIDRRMIDWAQTSYLWLLDWTGVYLGTVGLTVVVLEVGWTRIVAYPGPVRWYDITCLMAIGFTSTVQWMRQHRKKLEEMNDHALAWRDSSIRTWLISISIGFAVVRIAIGNWREAVGWVLLIVWFYLQCVLLRDREPKEFWKPKLATMGVAK